MIDNIASLVNSDARLVNRGRFVDTTFMIAIDDAHTLLRVQDGRVTEVVQGPFITPNYSFCLGLAECLGEILAATAATRLHRYFRTGEAETHAGRRRPASIHGQPALFQRRHRCPATGGQTMTPHYETITGRYLRCDLLGQPHRLYVEEAGQGIPMLCMHTAGADTRQYRGLLNDKRITNNFRVITFDMPWHGKTSPPAGWQDREYQLTAPDYVRLILDVIDALELEKPIVMGCSIGGRIVLHLAHQHPDRFRALIGLESAPYAEAYYDLSWLNRPDVHGGMVCAGVISGLIAPTVAATERWETLWHYMQSGPGVFKGDLYFYTTPDGDIRDRLDQIDVKRCPLFLLTGEYDYSCTAEAMLDIAKRTGAPATIMKGLGHFPMSEDSEKFVSYLLPVLEKIRAL